MEALRRPRPSVLATAALAALLPAIAFAQPCPVPLLDAPLNLPLPPFGMNSVSAPVVAADLDRDGATDLILTDRWTRTLWVIHGRRDRDFRPPSLLTTPPVTALYAALELKGPGKTDLLVQTASGPTVLAGDGIGGFRELPVSGIGPDFPPERWSFADLDGDGLLDVVVYSGGGQPSLVTFIGDGTGGFRRGGAMPLVDVPAGTPPESVALVLSDTRRDGRQDVAVSVLLLSSVKPQGIIFVVRGDGRGGFEQPVKVQDAGGYVAKMVDLDGDGNPDLLVVSNTGSGHGYAATATVFWGEGAGGFSTPQVVVSELLEGAFFLADLDGGGRPDLISAGKTSPVSVRSLVAGRTYGPPTLLSPGLFPTFTNGLGSGVDLDGDGRTDLVEGLAFWPTFKALINRCDGSRFARTFVVPVVVSIRGVGGAFFTSELVLTNRGATDVAVDLTYSAAHGGGSGNASLALPAGQQRILVDAMAELRALGVPIPEGEGNAGWLAIRFSGASSASDVSAQTRVRSSFAKGEVGVGIEPVPVLQGLTGPSIVPLLQENGLDRTNLAFVSLAGQGEPDVTLRVHLFPTDGTHTEPIELPDVRLAPGAFVQLDRVLASAGGGMASAWARIERVSGGGPYAAYAVLNDNASGDGSVVYAVPDAPNVYYGSHFFVPTVAETDRFTTELVLTNTTGHGTTARLSFRSSALGSTYHLESFEVPVPPGGQVFLPAFARPLCAGSAGVGAPVPCAGWLFLDLDGGVHALTRTTAAGGAGRFGLAIQASPIPFTTDAICWLDGLRQDAGHRTNIGLVNANNYPVRYRLDVFDGDSGLLAATVPDIEVEQGGWTQIDSLLAVHAPGISNAYVRVTLPRGGFPIAYGVVNDGPGAGQGNGDGTLLPMRFVPK